MAKQRADRWSDRGIVNAIGFWAVKELGVFWAIINEKPPVAALGEG
jgi:hypothetical protein